MVTLTPCPKSSYLHVMQQVVGYYATATYRLSYNSYLNDVMNYPLVMMMMMMAMMMTVMIVIVKENLVNSSF